MDAVQPVYHERQRKQLCALHMLNNLFQKKDTFTQKDLDDICFSLTPQNYWNPHRGVLGLGNYDVNVVAAALQTKDLSLVWFDRKRNILNCNLSNVKGVILNVPSDFKVGFITMPFDLKHWYVIREITGTYYNLDSKLPTPEPLGTKAHVLKYLKDVLDLEKSQILLVVTPGVEQDGSWYHEA